MVCPVCFLFANSGVSLANGEIIHSNCLQRLINDLENTNRILLSERSNALELRVKLVKQGTYIGKVIRFFRQGLDIKDLTLRIEAGDVKVLAAEKAYMIAREVATPIFDIMLDYPPDWSIRSAAVVERDKVCIKCRSSRTLQVHHIVPLSKGGTNHLSNLCLLCEKCHKRAHRGHEFSKYKSVVTLAIADRIQIINQAIASHNEVVFMYRKPTDKSYKKRRVTPYALVEFDHEHDDGQTLCLNCYCHLRGSDRSFALKRMKGLKIARR